MKTIEFFPMNEFFVLKVIQIEGPEWNWFTGYLPYLRTFNLYVVLWLLMK